MHSVPVAVGWMELSSDQLKRQGTVRGKAMQICHFWRDSLW